MPAISVVVPAYGVAHLVHEALESLQAQDFDDWEAVVIDDGAPDDVAGAVAKFADDPRVRLVETDNGGPSLARNRAVAAARAPLIALLDGDDRFEPDYLSTMIAAIGSGADIGFVTCDATNFGIREREGHPFSQYAPQEMPLTLDRVLSRRFNVYIGSVIRRDAYEGVGGFDASLHHSEDFDFWIRVLEAGWRGAYVPRRLGHYRRRPNSQSWDENRLLRGSERVYLAVAERLAGRPEAATATAALDRVRQELRWGEGENLIRQGKVRQGVAMLTEAGADTRSPRWRVAMPVMRHAPWLARFLIQIRD